MTYEIKQKDIYEALSKDKDIFDFSNHSPKSNNYDDSNKLVEGKMKDEIGGVVIKNWLGWSQRCIW